MFSRVRPTSKPSTDLVCDPAGERDNRLRRTAGVHPARRQRDRSGPRTPIRGAFAHQRIARSRRRSLRVTTHRPKLKRRPRSLVYPAGLSSLHYHRGRSRRAGEPGTALAELPPMLPAVPNIPRPMSRIPVVPRIPVDPIWSRYAGGPDPAVPAQAGVIVGLGASGPGECDSRRRRECCQGDE